MQFCGWPSLGRIVESHRRYDFQPNHTQPGATFTGVNIGAPGNFTTSGIALAAGVRQAITTHFILHPRYDLRAIDVRICWTWAAGTPGQAILVDHGMNAYADGDPLALAITYSQDTDTAQVALDCQFISERSFTPGGGASGGDLIVYDLHRRGDLGGDTLTGSIYIVDVQFRYGLL